MDINNQMKIQYGRLARTSNTHTISFPISFTTTRYSVIRTEEGPSKAQYDSVITARTTTNFSTYCAMKTDEKKTAILWMSIGY